MYTDKPQCGAADGGSHVAYLSVFALNEGEPHPTRRDVGTVADGWYTFPQVFWRINDFSLAGFCAVAFDGHAFFQLIDGLLRNLPIHLGEIGSRMLEFRVQELFDESPLVGKEQGAFAVVVEATCRIHSRRESKLVERSMFGLGGELAEDTERLVE